MKALLSRTDTPIVFLLIAINTACFVIFGLSDLAIDRHFALYFPQNDAFALWQYATHMFMHGGIFHLVFNMLGLWIFGAALERLWGSQRFFLFYFAAGIGAGVIYTLVNEYQFNQLFESFTRLGIPSYELQNILETGRYPRNMPGLDEQRLLEIYQLFHAPMVGASGAIYGILVAFAMSFPNHKLMLIFLPVPIAAKYFVPIILVIDLLSGITGFSIFGGGIAHFAHIGGAIIGFLIMIFYRR